MSRPRNRRGRPPARRGTIYVAVLGVTMIVAVMALAGASISRLELRIAGDQVDQQQARLLARSAIEFGLHWIEETPSWRADLQADPNLITHAFGEGAFECLVVDSDGSLVDDTTDGVTLYGYGEVGGAVAVESVHLMAAGDGLTCLEAALHSGSSFSLTTGDILARHDINTNQMVSANGTISANANYATIEGDAWATGAIAGQVAGSKWQNEGTPREMPGDSVFDYYTATGAWIDITSLPEASGSRVIEKQVLSPASNPYGATNPEGIYVIDCQGQSLLIKESRIVGTLVLLNPGTDCETDSVLLMEPAVANYPVLLVDGDFRIGSSNLTMKEGGFGGLDTNFNPVGTPYEGTEDSDQSDSYPSRLLGLVYVRGTARFEGIDFPRIDGGLVCGSLVSDTGYTVNYDDLYLNYPPPGFRNGDTMAIIPGTWRRAEDN